MDDNFYNNKLIKIVDLVNEIINIFSNMTLEELKILKLKQFSVLEMVIKNYVFLKKKIECYICMNHLIVMFFY